MRSYLAFAVVAIAAVGIIVVACGDSGQQCTTGKVTLAVQLFGTAAFADTITITSRDPVLMQTVPRDPNGPSLFSVDVDFPNGYPAEKVVTLSVSASGGITLLGGASANIHLLPKCSAAYVSVAGGAVLDGSVVD
jgi:hypothetical protein